MVAVELGHADTDHTTCLNVPSVGLVVAGDAAYNDVHLYLVESNAKSRREWTKLNHSIHVQLSPHISDLVRMTILVLLKRRDGIYAILTGLVGITATAQELFDKMLEIYPNRINPGWALWSSAHAAKQ